MIRRASAREATLLSQLAVRSKAYWGYSDRFIDACRDELEVSARDIEAGDVFVLDHDDRPAGFYSLGRLSSRRAELDALFVEPNWIGRGFGRALFEHARGEAATRGYTVLEIQGDPNAERFYLEMGARRFGQRESDSISNRVLPLFELDLRGSHPA